MFIIKVLQYINFYYVSGKEDFRKLQSEDVERHDHSLTE